MITGNEPIYPQIDTDLDFKVGAAGQKIPYDRTFNHTEGINLRQYYAGLAMQAVCALDGSNNASYELIASSAVTMADALIEALNK